MRRFVVIFALASLIFSLILSACMEADDGGRSRDDDDNSKAKEACNDAEDMLDEGCGTSLTTQHDRFFNNCDDYYDDDDCGDAVQDLLDCIDDAGSDSCSLDSDCLSEWNDLLGNADCSGLFEGGGSEPDGDGSSQTDGDEPTESCEGSCDPNVQRSFCVGQNVCYCEDDQWGLFYCSDVCFLENKTSTGCGFSEMGFDYCLCEDETADGDVVVVPDGDDPTDGDLPDTRGKFCLMLNADSMGEASSFCLMIDDITLQAGPENCGTCDDLPTDHDPMLDLTDCAGNSLLTNGASPYGSKLDPNKHYVFVLDAASSLQVLGVPQGTPESVSCDQVTYGMVLETLGK